MASILSWSYNPYLNCCDPIWSLELQIFKFNINNVNVQLVVYESGENNSPSRQLNGINLIGSLVGSFFEGKALEILVWHIYDDECVQATYCWLPQPTTMRHAWLIENTLRSIWLNRNREMLANKLKHWFVGAR